MILSSRPIRFFAMALGGWIGLRALALWPTAVLPPLIRALAPPAAAEAATRRPVVPVKATAIAERPRYEMVARFVSARRDIAPEPRSIAPPLMAAPVEVQADAVVEPVPPQPGTIAPPVFTSASRWSGSAWAILRPGGRATPFASQLGGSQAGVRIAYAVDAARRLAVTGRVSAAIGSRQREAAIGVDWRPTRLPVHLIAEHRFALDGGRGGPAIGAVGGIGPTPIAAGFRLEAYAQAGVIARDRAEGFADGSMRATRQVATLAGATVDLGGGAWGGAQRGATRLDVGPSLGLSTPVAGRTLRVAIDWRQRIAGRARPGSGPAVSLGTDF